MRLRTYGSLILAIAATSSYLHGLSFVQNPENGHYYAAVLSRDIAWDSAKSLAETISFNRGLGYLVTITSASEQAFVYNSFRMPLWGDAVDPFTYDRQVWIGGFQSPVDETRADAGWTWVNHDGAFPGNNVQDVYANWSRNTFGDPAYSGEPNDNFGPASEQSATMFRFADGSWNDYPSIGHDHGSSIAGYIIEVTPVPEPSAYAAGFAAALLRYAVHRRCRRHAMTRV